METRRPLRLVAAALVVAVPLLSSCGFNKQTNEPYTPAAGTNSREGQVDISAAVVVAAQPDSGTFIASLSNESSTEEDSLESVKGAGDWSDLQVDEVSPAIEVSPRDFVNLADGDGVVVRGDFEAGDVMTLTFGFTSGETVTMDVPVVYACEEWSGLDQSSEAGASASTEPSLTGEPSASEDATESATESPSLEPTPSPSEASESAEPSSSAEPYDCRADLEED